MILPVDWINADVGELGLMTIRSVDRAWGNGVSMT